MSKLPITIKIAGGSYPFTLEGDADEIRRTEEIYRRAERRVNELFTDYTKTYNLFPKDILSMVAFSLCIDNIQQSSERSQSLSDEAMRLAEIDKKLDDFFCALE